MSSVHHTSWPQEATPALGVDAPPGLSRHAIAWAYARHELLYICWALMDVALIAPAALALMPGTYFWSLPAFVFWLLLVMLIPFNLSRVMSLARVALEQQRKVIVISFIVTLLVAIRGLLYEPETLFDLSWLGAIVSRFGASAQLIWQRELVLFALIALLWWRGLALAKRHVAVEDVGFRMRLGGLLLAPLIVGLGLLPTAPSAIPFVMLFFLAALMAIALTRAEEVARHQSGAGYPMSPRWVATIFLTSLLVVSAAAVAGAAFGGGGLQQLLQWLSPLWNALALGGMVVVTTATYLLLFLLAPLQWLLRHLLTLLGEMGVQGLPEPEALAPELTDPNVDRLLLDLESQGALMVWANRAAVVLFILLILLVIYFGLRRYFYQRRISLKGTELAAAKPTMVRGERGLARRLRQRLARWRRWRAAATVRQLYRSMCNEAAARGFPRALSETPYEYAATLSEAWPDSEHDVSLITNAYVRVRYGEVPESAEELDEIRHAWRRLAQAPAPE